MSAYVIAEITIKNQDGYKNEFIPVVVPAIQAGGGKFLARGGKTQSFTGSPPASRIVLIQYESMDKAKTWWDSKTTQDIFKSGQKHADFRIFGVADEA